MSCCGKGSLELTVGEVALLELLGQYAFLPLCRRADDMTPIYLEDDRYSREEYSAIFQLLEAKRLISIDYSKAIGPVSREYPVGGSAALTARGQMILNQIQIQGVDE